MKYLGQGHTLLGHVCRSRVCESERQIVGRGMKQMYQVLVSIQSQMNLRALSTNSDLLTKNHHY